VIGANNKRVARHQGQQAASSNHLVLLEHALGFVIEKGGDPRIDTRTTRRGDYG
jgi:hypothetical protein